MATLNILGLTCVRTTAEARDEPYLRANFGDYVDPDRPAFSEIVITNLGTIWGPRSMNDGDALPVGWSTDFDAFIEVDLWEHDRDLTRWARRRPMRNDEHIATFQYSVGAYAPERRRIYPNVGESRYILSGHRATYEMIYDLRDMGDAPGTDLDRCELILCRITCNDAQEYRDEPYLVVNGERVWSADRVRTGQTRDINREVPFGSYARIGLWEGDRAVSNRINEVVVDFADFEPGELSPEQSHTFVAPPRFPGTARYTLIYQVRRLP